jgi:tetratricopeptide (TPR) repeat protein
MRFILSAVFVLLTIVMGITVADTNDNGVRTRILYSVDGNVKRFFPGFVDDLAKVLETHQVELHPWRDDIDDTANSALIHIKAHRTVNNGNNLIILQVQPHTPSQLAPSPALMPIHNQPTDFSLAQLQRESQVVEFVQLAAGLSLYAAGRCDMATDYLQLPEALDNDASGVSIARDTIEFYLGNCALLADEYDRAAEHFLAAISRTDDGRLVSSAPAINLIWTYLHTGRSLEAETWLESDEVLAAEDADELAIMSHRAYLYALAFRFDDAIADMDAVIERDPGNPEHHVQRGRLVMLLYEWDRVLEDYNTAIELDPYYAPAYYYRGILYYSILQRKPALEDFEQYIRLAPQCEYASQAETYAQSIQIELQSLGE